MKKKYLLFISIALISGAVANGAEAATQVSSIHYSNSVRNLARLGDPSLQCFGSGEQSGSHPGWSSHGANKLTVVDLGDSQTGVYWCPASAPSGKGTISYTITVRHGAITCETTDTYCVLPGVFKRSGLSIMATDSTGSYPLPDVASPNSGLIDNCSGLTPDCNPGPTLDALSTYGNVGSQGSLNCTFAAVANWERVVLGAKPDPSVITAEFASTGGVGTGLSNQQVFDFWTNKGIGGIRIKSETELPTDPVTLKNSINSPTIKAVIAQLEFIKGQNFAGITNIPSHEYHWVLVVGYTPSGPLVVTWGMTKQMTWQQWNAESIKMWKINT